MGGRWLLRWLPPGSAWSAGCQSQCADEVDNSNKNGEDGWIKEQRCDVDAVTARSARVKKEDTMPSKLLVCCPAVAEVVYSCRWLLLFFSR